MYVGKLKTRAEIKKIAQLLKNQGKKIVTTNGSFDLLHYGHIYTLEKAKEQGDILIVGLNSDSSIKLYKGSDRPIISEEYRAGILSALSCVDYITLFDEMTPMSFIESVKPDIHVNSAEYGRNPIERPTVEKYGGKLFVVEKISGLSTSKITEKIIALDKKDSKGKTIKDFILSTIEKQNGILFAKPAIVYREQYSGRNIIAKNSEFTKRYVDKRGYVPVEWWIMSKTAAENEKKKENEGLSFLLIETDSGEKEILFKNAVEIATKNVLGEYANLWPLTKILDIGGKAVKPSFSFHKEVPPIPAHVHSGDIVNGRAIGKGKLEAYFFPPVSVSPYNTDFGKTMTRLGIKPSIKRKDFIQSLKKFGKDDSLYNLCNTFTIHENEGWTIMPGVIHAPGPWTTFEIQLPQDDFNLASWQMGKRFSRQSLVKKKRSLQLRGLKNEEAFLDEVVDWKTCIDPNFEKKWHRPVKVLEKGSWGRRLQIFFDSFYGEAFEIKAGKTFKRIKDKRPFAGIVWSGGGKINGNTIDVSDTKRKEFLVTSYAPVTIQNTSESTLYIYVVFPVKK